jgi:uncharacterized protein (TIGR03435 family)
MKKLFVLIPLALFSAGALLAQNIVGDWQGTLATPQKPLRIVLKITRNPDESLKAVFYSIDQSGQGINASTAKLQGSDLKLQMPAMGASYEGKLGEDGNTVTGSFTQGGQPLPLNLTRATPSTAWAIPDPPPPITNMPADAKPTFEVATIKPSDPTRQGLGIGVNRAGLVTTVNTTVSDLITLAYGMHARQITNGPSWLETDRYDITAKPDTPGMPNPTQLRSMIQGLLKERFQLAFHYDEKELSAYSLTVGKNGVKMTKSEASNVQLPGIGGRAMGNIVVRNATMNDFAEFLQTRVLERPVIDQTNLKDRFDFTLVWTPDAAQVAQSGANAPPPPPPGPDSPPDLFGSVSQQLGLNLQGAKLPVKVMVVDKLEKPSAN